MKSQKSHSGDKKSQPDKVKKGIKLLDQTEIQNTQEDTSKDIKITPTITIETANE